MELLLDERPKVIQRSFRLISQFKEMVLRDDKPKAVKAVTVKLNVQDKSFLASL